MNSFFVALILICQCIWAAAPACEAVLVEAGKFSHEGVLGKSGDFVYVKVDDAYIHELIKIIGKEGFVEPPYFVVPGLVGAHISVFYPEEVKKCGIKEVAEVGKKVEFQLVTCERL